MPLFVAGFCYPQKTSGADDDHGAGHRLNRLVIYHTTTTRKSPLEMESASQNAVDNRGDAGPQLTAVVPKAEVLKTGGDDGLERPVIPTQDQDNVNVFIFLKIVSPNFTHSIESAVHNLFRESRLIMVVSLIPNFRNRHA